MNPPEPDQPPPESPQQIGLHVFSVSATLVGLCLTVIGLVRIVVTTGKTVTLADDLLVLNALLFLTACIASYWALRTRRRVWARNLARLAEWSLHLGLAFMVVVCGIIVYEIA